MAILERSTRISISVLLSIHNTTFYGLLNLQQIVTDLTTEDWQRLKETQTSHGADIFLGSEFQFGVSEKTKEKTKAVF